MQSLTLNVNRMRLWYIFINRITHYIFLAINQIKLTLTGEFICIFFKYLKSD